MHLTNTKDMQRLGERLAEIERVMQGKPTLNAAPANDPSEAWPLEDGDPTSTLHQSNEEDRDGNPPHDFNPAA
jgi:hypothetical protein